MKTKTVTKPKAKSYDELLGIHQGYMKMLEVLTAKNTPQLREMKRTTRALHINNNKEYRIK